MRPTTPNVAACAYCTAWVDLSKNHATDPIAHVYCAFDARRVASTPPSPEDVTASWLRTFARQGYAYTGEYREVGAFTAERGAGGGYGGWDIPADLSDDFAAGPHMSWVAVDQTLCPGGEYLPWRSEVTYLKTLVCREKHYHPADPHEMR